MRFFALATLGLGMTKANTVILNEVHTSGRSEESKYRIKILRSFHSIRMTFIHTSHHLDLSNPDSLIQST
ncbi:MAG: hypothetical protein QME58_12760 [Bacteroidota bacterium]|nr:hypothetical protein [Bacteroidota bacterium]